MNLSQTIPTKNLEQNIMTPDQNFETREQKCFNRIHFKCRKRRKSEKYILRYQIDEIDRASYSTRYISNKSNSANLKRIALLSALILCVLFSFRFLILNSKKFSNIHFREIVYTRFISNMWLIESLSKQIRILNRKYFQL